jgi:predicted metalloprotease
MLWQGRRESENVEDERGSGGGGRIVLGGGIGTIILVVLYLLLGGDPQALFNSQQAQLPQSAKFDNQAPRDEASKFVAVDLGFFRQLQDRLGAGGDFAEAYVIAHEVGHHVQNLLGISDRVQAARGRVSQSEYNQLSVRLELQADFLAGVWARYTDRVKHVVEAGDIEEAMRAASAVGDDRLQSRSRGYVVPDSFTHGTSEQRARWFRRGYDTGDLSQGDTFNAREL